MGTLSKVFGVLFNILSFAMLYFSAVADNPPEASGVSPSFGFWIYSCIFALIAMILYLIGAIKSADRCGIGRFIFTFAVFILFVLVGGSLNITSIVIWNSVFAINLILQIIWIF